MMRGKIAQEPREPTTFDVVPSELVPTARASSKTRRTKLPGPLSQASRGSEVSAMAHLTSEFVDNSLFLADHVQKKACSCTGTKFPTSPQAV